MASEIVRRRCPSCTRGLPDNADHFTGSREYRQRGGFMASVCHACRPEARAEQAKRKRSQGYRRRMKQRQAMTDKGTGANPSGTHDGKAITNGEARKDN